MLVLVHGTFSDTVGTFGKLWTLHPRPCASCSRATASASTALDHPTLGASPIANALTLVRAMPAGRAAAPRHAFARRPGRRGAGARLQRRAARQCGARAVRRRGLRAITAPTCARWSRRRRPRACGSSASCASAARRAARCSRRSGSTPISRSCNWCLELASIPVVARAGRLPARSRAPPCRPERAARARGDDCPRAP